MRRLVLALFALFFWSLSAQAQDLLTKTNGEELLVKVLEITPTEVSYKRADNLDGPLIKVRRNDVFMIRYANGTKEVVQAGPPPSPYSATGPQPAAPSNLVVPDDAEPVYQEVHLSGPRLGMTVLTGGVARKADDRLNLNPFLTQFGWQFETRIFRMPNGTSGLVEVVPLVGGLEQGKFIPSVNALIGIRGPKGFEFGLGPNLTPISANIALAIGTSFRANGVNFPVNFAVVPGNGGARFSLLFGFNSRKR
ncbi:hypothetical protein [Hymenobacter crusticola]|uniref:Uncharacterized protein n=1 Tax=Hymenobacter crusticola TaxID=1770526 RepID=A0A243WKR6_9BACT|nr:hypothetical protein [Hymenobacter crusticola]OUJ75927.1 hypothetical protein BXP70_01170 [Hymenobacter crusticola]